MKRFSLLLKVGIATILMLSIFSGCSKSDEIKAQYPLVSVNNNGDQTSYVYRAKNQTVPETAKQITEDRKPEQVSEENSDQMFIVYSDELYNLQKDPKNPNDTLIEIDNKEFVKNNYDSSFLKGFIAAQILDHFFDLLDHSYGSHGGSYHGYGDRDVYKPNGSYHKPTAADKEKAPPVTVSKKGSITRRGSHTSSGSSSTSTSGHQSKGKINRSQSDDGGGSWFHPKKNSHPRTHYGGYGKIKRR
ncbi:DUF4247 domain-containing protein [Fictibacillus sp. Mic-4]|uniref:DUF4247 domain-containing protein n=1 Tax=Fictibacillus TaxID=1329200 RepID=UPI0004001DAC|nr:DUF4247 domain-containing protein [Fictibacillus gelatini]